MKWLVCRKCDKEIEISKALKIRGNLFCPYCKSFLSYFGKEEAQISQKAILDAFDKNHDLNVMANFRGYIPVTYENPEINTMILELEDTLKLNPANIQALFSLAKLYLSQKNFQYAEEMFKKILDLDDELIDARQGLVDMYLGLKKWDMAIEQLKSIQKLDEDNFKVDFNLGRVFFQKKEFQVALQYFMSAYKKCDDEKSKKEIYDYIFRLCDELKIEIPEII